MSSRRVVAGLTLVVVFGVGCPGEPSMVDGGQVSDAGRVSSDAGRPQADAGVPVPDAGPNTTAAQITAWCDRVTHLVTEIGSRCGVSISTYIEPAFPDERCVMAAGLLDAGTLVFDGVVAQRCIDESLAACTLPARTASCRGALSGTVSEGSPCNSVECERNLYCDVSGATCPGHCRGRLDAGVLPPSAEACPLGTLSFDSSPCHVPQPVGAPCFINSKLFACVSGAFCSIGTGGSSTCQLLRDAGAPCAEGVAICQTGLQCASDNGASAACVSFGAVGDRCAIDDLEHLGAPSPGCKHGLACGDGGICEAEHSVGQSCYFDSNCSRGWCDRSPGTTLGACADFRPAGATCTSSNRCAEGTRCDGKCTAVARAGEVCTDTVGCESYFTCNPSHRCSSSRWPCTK